MMLMITSFQKQYSDLLITYQKMVQIKKSRYPDNSASLMKIGFNFRLTSLRAIFCLSYFTLNALNEKQDNVGKTKCGIVAGI